MRQTHINIHNSTIEMEHRDHIKTRAVPNTVISLFGRIPNIYRQYSAEYGSNSNSLETKLLTVANLKLLNACRSNCNTDRLSGPGLDAGPIIARTDSYQSICIGSLQPHLFRHAVVQSASSNKDCWLLTHARCIWSASIAPWHGLLYIIIASI